MSGAPIATDDPTTWPQSVSDTLSICREKLEQRRGWIVDEIFGLIRDAELLAYHCTRLTDAEITNVKKVGLRPLTEELRRARVEDLIAAGGLCPELGARLLAHNPYLNLACRLGLISFYLTKDIGPECWKFFRYWGGEAVFLLPSDQPHYERDRASLKSVGVPCIVEAKVPVRALRLGNPAGQIIKEYAKREGLHFALSHEYDCVDIALEVVRVLRFGDEEFTNRADTEWYHGPIHP
jgi:hypothetical protein